jgi:hypothetical protein
MNRLLLPRLFSGRRCSSRGPGTRGEAEPVGDREAEDLLHRQGRDDELTSPLVELAQEPVQLARAAGHGRRDRLHCVCLHRGAGEGWGKKDADLVPLLLVELRLVDDLLRLDQDNPRSGGA